MKKNYTEPKASMLDLLSSDIMSMSVNVGLNTGDIDSAVSVGGHIDIGGFEEF